MCHGVCGSRECVMGYVGAVSVSIGMWVPEGWGGGSELRSDLGSIFSLGIPVAKLTSTTAYQQKSRPHRSFNSAGVRSEK